MIFLFLLILQVLAIFWNFYSAHPNLCVTYEEQANGCFNFPGIKLMRRANETIKRLIHKKATWSTHYLHFTDFTPIVYRADLAKTFIIVSEGLAR